MSLQPPASSKGGFGISAERALRRNLLLIVSALVILGTVAVYSSTSVMANETYGQPLHYVFNHVVALGLGLLLSAGCLTIPLSAIRQSAKPALIISIGLLIAVMIFGFQVGGARRWFRLGPLSVQPSEFTKLALVVYLADFFTRKPAVIQRFREGFVPPMLITGLLAGLLLLQPDLGNAIVMTLLTIILLALAKTRWQYLAWSMALGAVMLVLLIGSEEYRRRRMLAFLDPWQDPLGAGFQILQSYIAMAGGGLIGQGLGASLQKLFYLPGAHTDFIFAIIGEELGLVGTTAVLLLFLLLMTCGIRMAYDATDPFRKYLLCGSVALIAVEAAIHVSVVTGLMPTKGLPLPLVSYGGSSMISHLVLCAFMLQASKAPHGEPIALAAPPVGRRP